MLKRKIETKLLEYYSNTDAPILILTGARQIGKTFIIRETAKLHFKNYIEVNLSEDYYGARKYESINNVHDFYLQIAADFGNKIHNSMDTIIFLDEIQLYPQLISLLKPLKEDSRYRYIASGSLLGISLKHIFIPMGSINEVKMYPLDFEEFLMANNVDKTVVEYLRQCFINKEKVSENIHKTILSKFKEYLICGGLPKAVNEYVNSNNVFKVREIQHSIYNYYKDDASQYDAKNNLKIKRIYDFLPSYMENKVKRIKFKSIDADLHANLVKYENEFDYLINSGSTLPTKAVANPIFPLIESSTKNLIKLYYNDVGILTNILYKNSINELLFKDIGINLGCVYETVCAMELIAHGHTLYYFDSKKVGEVDFLINDYENQSVCPIEIKSGNDQTNFRALPKLVKEPYNLKTGIVLGNKNITEENDNIITYPIYFIMFI